MRQLVRISGLLLLLLSQPLWACPEMLDFTFTPLGGGKPERLCEAYADKVVLVVNTASKCSYTYQYDDLEKLYQRYRDQGLVVLGFPSNDFGQEPWSEKEIKAFCRLNIGLEFPLYQKIHAAEKDAHPLFRSLAKAGGGYPQWNFHKYLLDRNGKLVTSWGSKVEPLDSRIVGAVEKTLAQPAH